MITLDRIFPPAAGQHARLQGGSGDLPCHVLQALFRAGPARRRKTDAPAPAGGEKAQRGLRLLPHFSNGELANSMKGWGGVRNEPSPARPTRPAPRGPRSKGDKRRSGSGTRRAAARGSAGREGPRGFFSRAMKAAVPVPPAVSPPLVDSSLEGGSGKGGFQRGGN